MRASVRLCVGVHACESDTLYRLGREKERERMLKGRKEGGEEGGNEEQ